MAPLVTVLFIGRLARTPAQESKRADFAKIAGAVWMPGIGSALSSIGFGAMLAFSSLLFTERGWTPIWLPFSAFALALVAARVTLGHLPDRVGGAKVALVSVLIEAAGLVLIWLATGPALAATGAALTGFGYALVYPGLGAEAVRRAPPQSRGLAMGAYTVFLDVALGFGSPLLGIIAGWHGLGAVFLASAILVLAGAVFATILLGDRSVSGPIALSEGMSAGVCARDRHRRPRPAIPASGSLAGLGSGALGETEPSPRSGCATA